MRRAVLLALVLGAHPACHSDRPEPIRRLLTTGDAVPFARHVMSEIVDVSREADPSISDPTRWSVVAADASRRALAAGRELESPGGDLKLEAATRLESSAVDVVEVVIVGLQPAALPQLAWLSEDAASCADCSVRLMWRDGEGPRKDLFRFEVSSRPGWSGTITKLVLKPTNLRNNRVRIERIALLKRRIDREKLARMRARPVLYAVKEEARPAVLLTEGAPLRARVDVHRGDSLRFGLAREPAARRDVEVSVTAQVGTEDPLPLSTIRLEAAAAAAGWQNHSVDLSVLGSRSAELSFKLSASGAGAELRELSFLGSPELVAKGARLDQPNILFISIDTLRADRLSLYGYQRPTSPRLSAWSERTGAVVFERTVAAAASTLPSHASMFSGLEALHHGAYLSHALRPQFELLAELLRDAGYRTLAVTGGGFLHPRFGLAQGFDRFHFWPRGQVDGGDELADGVKRTNRWLAELEERPFFLFFHTYEVHAPYRAREPYFSQWSGASPALTVQPWLRQENEEDGYLTRNQWPRVWGDGDPRDLRPEERALVSDLYDSGVAQVDSAIAEILESLRVSDHDGNTIVLVTSDHGEALGERDFFDHGYLYDHNLLVPLVILDPRNARGMRRVSRQVRQIDILPTLLDLAGLPARAGIDGVSLASWVTEGRGTAGLEAWSYAPETNHGIALRKDRLKFILRDSILAPRDLRSVEYYALDVDPREEHDLAADQGENLAPLRGAAHTKLEAAVSGTELEWRNQGDAPAKGRILWDGARRHNAKLAGAPTGAFRMPAPGRLEFEIPARSTARARFMASGDSLEYRIELDGALVLSPTSGRLEFAELCQGIKSLLVPGATGRKDEEPTGLHISAKEIGSCAGGSRSDRIGDADLAAGLRALGYLR